MNSGRTARIAASHPAIMNAQELGRALYIQVEGVRLVKNEIRRLAKAPSISATLLADNIIARLAPDIGRSELVAIARNELARRWRR